MIAAAIGRKKETPPEAGPSHNSETLLAGASFGEITMNFGDELASWSRRTNLTVQDLRERDHLGIQILGSLIVLFQLGTINIDAGKQSLRTRVREDFGIQLPVCVGRGLTSNRTGSCAGINSDFELAVEELLRPLIIHDQHQQIRRLSTDLCSPASAPQEHGCRCAPGSSITRQPAGCEASAITTAESQGSLLLIWNGDYAFGMFQQVGGHAFVGCGKNLLQHAGGGIQPLGYCRMLIVQFA